MKKITFLACTCLSLSFLACNQESSTSDSSNDFGLKTLAARGDGSEAFASADNTNTENTLEITPGTLTAGEWKDLDNWGFWQALMQKEMYFNFQSQWQYFPTQRYSVIVTGKDGQPVHDASVKLLSKDNTEIWSSKTNNTGVAELWAQPFQEKKVLEGNYLVIESNKDKEIIKSPKTFAQGLNKVKLSKAFDKPANIAEVMVVVDATGSMEDEIAYMRKELEDVVNRVKAEQPEMELKLGSVFYRDQGDEYLTRISNLSADATATINFMNQQSADGGGDYPEAVDVALEEAIVNQNWSTSARSRVLFLMLDAPPHQDTESFIRLQNSIKAASQKGIKIIPIASSGIDKDTEFLLRFMTLTTNGSYVFLTDHSGIGNEHVEPTIGEYRVEYLNDLLARIIIESSETTTPIVQ